ncbi:hypothetical protein CU254_41755 (plasmid) [Amycolatopsis sp. AA4]|nr:hypothetical protein CU254_41755 [Amycolatopsis sp. AA4]EFL12662.1 predicted protein [Streptomyces sp. AA4]
MMEQHPADSPGMQIGGRTETILWPEGWSPAKEGEWLFYNGAEHPDGEIAVEVYRRFDHPRRPSVPEWTAWFTYDTGENTVQHNPVTITGPDDADHEFWPASIADLQELLRHVGRYGHAQPAHGGWAVTPAVTEAAARAAASEDSFRHVVLRNGEDDAWTFVATGTPVPLAGQPGLRQADQTQELATAGTEKMWLLYVAKYDVGPQHSELVPDTIRLLESSRDEISFEHLQETRQRSGLGHDVHTVALDVPAGASHSDLAEHLTRYLTEQPKFDFWDEVIGDDIVVGGVVYDGDVYELDGEGGVRERTSDADPEYPDPMDDPENVERLGALLSALDAPNREGQPEASRDSGENPNGDRPAAAPDRQESNAPSRKDDGPAASRSRPAGTAGARHGSAVAPGRRTRHR